MAAFGILSTFNTQRYDPHPGRQASSILGSAKATDVTITAHSHHSPRLSASHITIKESPKHEQCLQRSPISSSSFSPSTALWHEDRSTGVCTTTNTELFEGCFSPATSVTSFHLSADQHTMSGVGGGKGLVTGVKEQLVENILSASQVEAHIPPRASVDSFTTAMSEDDEAEIWRRFRLVSPVSVCVVGTSRNSTPSTTLRPTAAIPPSISHCFHQVHPEYNSDYDESTDDVGSFQSSFSGSSGLAEDEAEAEENDSLDFCDPEVTPSPIASTSTSSGELDYFDPALPFPPPPSSSSSSLPSSIRFRSPNTENAWDEIPPRLGVPTIASTSRQPPFAKYTGSSSSLPVVQGPILYTTSPSSPTSSAVNRDVWWRNFPKHFRRVSDSGSGSESEADAEKKRTEAPNCPQLSHGDQRMGNIPSNGEVGPVGEKTLAVPLPPTASCADAGRYKSSQTKSRLRRVLPVIFPCIPIYDEGNFDEITVAPEPVNSTVTNLEVTSMAKGLTKTTQGGAGKRGLKKQKSTGTVLEVKVDRHVSRKTDWNSA